MQYNRQALLCRGDSPPDTQDTQAALSWEAVNDAAEYEVKADGIVLYNGNETYCMHNGLTAGTEHTYRVRAKNAVTISEWSTPVTVTTYMLPTPANLNATSNEFSL